MVIYYKNNSNYSRMGTVDCIYTILVYSYYFIKKIVLLNKTPLAGYVVDNFVHNQKGRLKNFQTAFVYFFFILIKLLAIITLRPSQIRP